MAKRTTQSDASRPIDPKSGTWGVALSGRIGGLGRDGNGSERMDRSPCGWATEVEEWSAVAIPLAALLRPLIRIESCNQWISCNYSKCQWRRAGKDTLPPDPAPTRNPDPACAPTPAGTPTPARTPTPAGTPAPPAAAPTAAWVPAPTAMPPRSVAPGISSAELSRGGKGGKGDDDDHQKFTRHRRLLSRPPIGSGPAEV